MEPGFKPPENEAEFQARTKDVTSKNARLILRAVRERRRAATEEHDKEIEFYERVLRERGEEE